MTPVAQPTPCPHLVSRCFLPASLLLPFCTFRHACSMCPRAARYSYPSHLSLHPCTSTHTRRLPCPDLARRCTAPEAQTLRGATQAGAYTSRGAKFGCRPVHFSRYRHTAQSRQVVHVRGNRPSHARDMLALAHGFSLCKGRMPNAPGSVIALHSVHLFAREWAGMGRVRQRGCACCAVAWCESHTLTHTSGTTATLCSHSLTEANETSGLYVPPSSFPRSE